MPPLLFLHGWTMTGAVFDDLIARIGEDFECFAPDLPGHASALDHPATLDACATGVHDALARWPGRRPVLVGWSMGAAVAWRYCERYGSDALAGLVTVDMSPKIVSGPGWPHGLLAQDADSVAATTQRFETDWNGAVQSIATTMFATKRGSDVLSRDDALKVITGQNPDKMRALWDDMLAMDARETVQSLDLPMLVCSGGLSRVYPAAAADWIAAQAPHARRYVFEKSGHSPHLEEPEAFAQAITQFASSLVG